MGRIVILDERTANQIAAGEVVEGPASIVKEMVENAVDAGATQVGVEIRNGGIRFIRVTDNGSGLERDDVEMAFERHATSKIRRIDDLDDLRSMGFRGEALASIASVSRLEMLTRTAQEEMGTRVLLEGGTLLSVEQAGGPVGTTFLVRDLFFNTPARYKFLKKDATEAGRVADVMERLALAHPDIALTLTSNGETVLRTPGNGELASVVFALYGKQTADALLPLDYRHDGMEVSGFIGRPAIARGNRQRQTFLMNGRVIRSAPLSAALDEGFRTLLMTRQYAFAVVVLTLPPQRVDVNVHPAKLEVRFSDERAVFAAVHGAVRNALLADAAAGGLVPAEALTAREEVVPPPASVVPIRPPGVPTSPGMTEAVSPKPFARAAGQTDVFSAESVHPQGIQQRLMPESAMLPGHAGQLMAAGKPASRVDVKGESMEGAPEEPRPDAMAELRPESMAESRPDAMAELGLGGVGKPRGRAEPVAPRHPVFLEMRLVGQVFDSFLVLEHREEMLLLDQHAAHERIRFEDLRWGLRHGSVPSQPFLQPVAIHLTASEYDQALQILPVMEKLGFEMEAFGGRTLLVRAIPATFDGGLSEAELAAIVAEGISDTGSRQGAVSEETLHSISCKGAIKANRSLSAPEIVALLERLSGLENPYTCVHGRPILLRFPRRELEKRFKRIV